MHAAGSLVRTSVKQEAPTHAEENGGTLMLPFRPRGRPKGSKNRKPAPSQPAPPPSKPISRRQRPTLEHRATLEELAGAAAGAATGAAANVPDMAGPSSAGHPLGPEADNAAVPGGSAPPAVRKRGRPPGSKNRNRLAAKATAPKPAAPPTKSGRPRGRPRKHPKPVEREPDASSGSYDGEEASQKLMRLSELEAAA